MTCTYFAPLRTPPRRTPSLLQTAHQRQILERASQVVGTLQRPPIAATVLNQPWTPTGKSCNRHSNPTSSLALLRFATSMGGSNSNAQEGEEAPVGK